MGFGGGFGAGRSCPRCTGAVDAAVGSIGAAGFLAVDLGYCGHRPSGTCSSFHCRIGPSKPSGDLCWSSLLQIRMFWELPWSWEWAVAGFSLRFKIITGVLTYLAVDRSWGWGRYWGLVGHVPREVGDLAVSALCLAGCYSLVSRPSLTVM